MQLELDAEGLTTPIKLLAINEEGYESSLPGMAALGDIPLLQDTEEAQAWTSWEANYRDVIIVDKDGVQVGVYNLTQNTLSNEDNYAELKELLKGFAGN